MKAEQPTGEVTEPASLDEVDLAISQWAQERPDLDPSVMSVFGRLSRVAVLQRTVLNNTHAASGLTVGSFDVLAQLRRYGRPHLRRASDLANSSLLSSGGITFRLDRMEADGLIVRERSSEDRRTVYAKLTLLGSERIDRAIELHLGVEADLLDSFTTEERATLVTLLTKLEKALAEKAASTTAGDGTG